MVWYYGAMLYTGKGDKGDTGIFGCDQRISKSSAVAEALGALDEVNSFLGVCKVKAHHLEVGPPNDVGAVVKLFEILEDIQQNLFVVQAEVAGADKYVSEEKIKEVEKIIDGIEKALPAVKSFFVSGGIELSALLDFTRTLARRAERRVVMVREEGKIPVGDNTLTYLNRLSSLLFALARLVNHKSGIKEKPPRY